MVSGGGSIALGPSWNPEHRVVVPGYNIIPRRGGPVYGEGLIDGRSENIYRYLLQ
jgi:hypothetical protein